MMELLFKGYEIIKENEKNSQKIKEKICEKLLKFEKDRKNRENRRKLLNL